MTTEQLTYRGWHITLRPGTFIGFVALVKYPGSSVSRKKFQAIKRDDVLAKAKAFIDETQALAKELTNEQPYRLQ